jgi:CRP-like cAMP-binding protein
VRADDFDLLADLNADVRHAVVTLMVRRTYQKGETLFHEGDPGDTLHLIEKGRVAIRPSTPNGDVVTLTVLGPGAFFGEQALLSDDAVRTSSAVAMEAVETRMLHRRDLTALRREQPSIDRFIVSVLAAQVRRLSNQVLEALYTPAEHRVVRRLAELARLYDSGTATIDIGVRQEDVATMAGTTRPTANRALQDLVDGGVIALRRGHIEVIDRTALAKRAGR